MPLAIARPRPFPPLTFSSSDVTSSNCVLLIVVLRERRGCSACAGCNLRFVHFVLLESADRRRRRVYRRRRGISRPTAERRRPASSCSSGCCRYHAGGRSL